MVVKLSMPNVSIVNLYSPVQVRELVFSRDIETNAWLPMGKSIQFDKSNCSGTQMVP